MKHVAFGGFALQIVYSLLIYLCPQGGNGQSLSLSPGEECGTVSARQNAHLAADGPDLMHVSAVHPAPLAQNHLANVPLLQLLQNVPHLPLRLREFLQKLQSDCIRKGIQSLLPLHLISGSIDLFDLLQSQSSDGCHQLRIFGNDFHLRLGFTQLGLEFLLQLDYLSDLLVSELKRSQKIPL